MTQTERKEYTKDEQYQMDLLEDLGTADELFRHVNKIQDCIWRLEEIMPRDNKITCVLKDLYEIESKLDLWHSQLRTKMESEENYL